jgi:hypothetical protein
MLALLTLQGLQQVSQVLLKKVRISRRMSVSLFQGRRNEGE